MNVLITGGAGFLGINLIRHLLAGGEYRLSSLDKTVFDFPEKQSIQISTADIRDREAAAAALEGTDCVIHAASALPLYRREEIFSTIVDGTGLLLEESARAGVDRFIHISSTAVYGVPSGGLLREDNPLVGVGPYGRAKIQAEELCRDARRGGMCITVIRPKSFIGPERLGVFELLYDWAARGRSFPVIGSGNNRYQLLDVEDLCSFIETCMKAPGETVNDVFNIGAGEFDTIRNDFQAVLDAAGYGRRIVPLPAGPVKLALTVLEALRLSPLYGWVYRTAGKESAVDIRKAREKTGFRPVYSNRDALLRNFSWYLENRDRLSPSTGTDHRSPWKRGILSLAERFF